MTLDQNFQSIHQLAIDGPPVSAKPKFPRAIALEVARELCLALQPVTDRLIVAGSLRRRKEFVGDVEILFIPKFEPIPRLIEADLFAPPSAPEFRNLADQALDAIVQKAIITQRKNTLGSISWGPKNKLAVHTATGVPVDLFTATPENWFNYLVCRTGSEQNNIRIASAAIQLGWKWNPYGSGFTDASGQFIPVHSERAVFSLVRLPYPEPHLR